MKDPIDEVALKLGWCVSYSFLFHRGRVEMVPRPTLAKSPGRRLAAGYSILGLNILGRRDSLMRVAGRPLPP